MKIFACFILSIIFLTGSNIHCQTLVGIGRDFTEFIKAPQSKTASPCNYSMAKDDAIYLSLLYEWPLTLTLPENDVYYRPANELGHKDYIATILREELHKNDINNPRRLEKKIKNIASKLDTLYQQKKDFGWVGIQLSFVKYKNNTNWAIDSINGQAGDIGIKITFDEAKIQSGIDADTASIDITMTQKPLTKLHINIDKLSEILKTEAPLLNKKGNKIKGLDLSKIHNVVDKLVTENEIPTQIATIHWSLILKREVNGYALDIKPEVLGEILRKLNYSNEKEMNDSLILANQKFKTELLSLFRKSQ